MIPPPIEHQALTEAPIIILTIWSMAQEFLLTNKCIVDVIFQSIQMGDNLEISDY